MEVLSLTALTLNYLRENIIMGKLKPGEKLNECNLSNLINVSRPPIREAFRLLENEQLVINSPRKGTYVNQMSIKDFTEISQIREMIECYVIDLLKASRIKDLPKVKSSLDEALALPPSTNEINPEQLLKRIGILVKFHKSLVESAGNRRLINLYQSNSYNLARYQFLYFQLKGSEQHSLENHQATLDFIRHGEYNQAKKELKKHIAYVNETIRNTLSQSHLINN
jgi:DNA-binding GntR family transcriptional regulator